MVHPKMAAGIDSLVTQSAKFKDKKNFAIKTRSFSFLQQGYYFTLQGFKISFITPYIYNHFLQTFFV